MLEAKTRLFSKITQIVYETFMQTPYTFVYTERKSLFKSCDEKYNYS